MKYICFYFFSMLKISNNSWQKPPIELLKKSILIDELHWSYFPAFLYDKNNNKFLVTENEIKKVITVTKKLKWFIYVQKIQWELLIDLWYQPIDNNQIINCITLEEKEVNINFAWENWEIPRIEMPIWETVWLCHLDLDKHILSRFQLNGEPKMVIAILEDWKTVFVKWLWPCFLNPEDKKNL